METNKIDTSSRKRQKVTVVKKNETVEGLINYNQQHLRNFLLARPAISIAHIENVCGVPNGTLRHFIKKRRSIPLNHFDVVENELTNYGYLPLESE